MRAYRSKEFDKLFVIADPTNGANFVKEVSLYIIHLIFVICFVTSCVLNSTLNSLFSTKWVLQF